MSPFGIVFSMCIVFTVGIVVVFRTAFASMHSLLVWSNVRLLVYVV